MKSRSLVSLIAMPLFVVLLAMAPAAQASTTWYVNGVSGNDSNVCTAPADACKTIGHAISLAASGDSVILAPATYNEQISISMSLNVIGSGSSTTIIDGGGIHGVVRTSGSHVAISNVTIRNGFSGGGGGISNGGTLTVNNSTISGNQVWSRYGPALGGGIYNAGTLTINDSTLIGNRASSNMVPGQGGGIYNAGTLMINNSTVAGNIAIDSRYGLFGQGGGIFSIFPGARTEISNSTLSGNSTGTGGKGGGIFGSVILQNSIVANSLYGGNCSGAASNGYNLSSDGTCNFKGAGDLNNHDPLLGPLQNNGGPTLTMALLPGSPAIDAGNPSGCTDTQGHLLTTDQRGMPRPDKEDKGGCDIGAYESPSD